LTGTFQQLFTYTVFTGWMFYGLAAASIFVYRRKRPDSPRPYSVPFYPWTPLLFILAAVALVANTIVAQPRPAAIGLAIVFLGAPVYLVWRARKPAKAIAVLLSLFFSVAIAPCTLQASAETRYAPTVQMLEKFIEHEMADKELPALSIALVDDQEMVWAKGFGFARPETKVPATADTVYRAGAVSELFTDIAIMQLVEQGKLDLDAPIARYLPDFKPDNPFGKSIPLRQLLSQPGTHGKQSNAAIATAGFVIERTQREPFAQYAQRAVLQPLGLTHSSFAPGPEITANLAEGFMWTIDGRVFEAPAFPVGIAPADGLYATAGDLGRFLSALFAGRVLEASTLAQMSTPQSGFGFRVAELNGHRQVGHEGSVQGFATSLEALPDDKIGVVVLTNKDAATAVTRRIADLALRAMLAARRQQPGPEPEITAPVDPQLARRLAGRYKSGDQGVDLIESGGNLSLLAIGGGRQVRVRSLGDALIVDDRLSYGEKILVRGEEIVIGGETLRKVSSGKPPEPNAQWTRFIGEYGADHGIVYIFEKDKKLWALMNWFEFAPLEQVSANVFRFPSHGLYDGERVVFTRDAGGRATGVTAANVFFPRRKVGPEEGAPQLRVAPVRPIADLFRESAAAEPPKETGEFRTPDLVEPTALDPSIKLEIRYATTNNFLGTVFYSEARAFLQRPAAEAAVRAHRRLKKLGYGLLIHDAYRPWYVTKMFWDAVPADKKIFVADPSQGSRHNRGCAVDLTLYDLTSGKPVQMVSTYDETTDRAAADYPGGTSLQRWHRNLLREAMESEGFTVYGPEWWHFDYQDWRSYPIMNLRFEKIGTVQRGAS
jgi:D-alanyl-D-alanine dipeptidase/CubicO group peptidase (beta-lactamase class C family)